MTTKKKIFCFGYGYTCDYLGHELNATGAWGISGTTRDDQRKEELVSRGIDAYIFDHEHPLSSPSEYLRDTTHVLISTPPNDEGDPTYLMHAQDILNIPSIEWVGYLSTIGVYGNRDGASVDETSEIQPTSQRGSRRALAEEQWFSLAQSHGLPVHSFRLSGIYGPGRSALDSVRTGIARRIDKPGHAFNRIHVEDIVQVLMASIHNPSAPNWYNVADDKPAPSHEVIEYACDLLGFAKPPMIPFDEADMAPMARSFYGENKRVVNEKIKRELGIVLKYPEYKSGLDACLRAEDHAKSRPIFG